MLLFSPSTYCIKIADTIDFLEQTISVKQLLASCLDLASLNDLQICIKDTQSSSAIDTHLSLSLFQLVCQVLYLAKP